MHMRYAGEEHEVLYLIMFTVELLAGAVIQSPAVTRAARITAAFCNHIK